MNKQMTSGLAQGDQTPVFLVGSKEFMGKKIPVLTGGFGEDNMVIADKTIAEIHNTEAREVRRLIKDNLKRFKESIDFIDLKKAVGITHDNLESFGYSKMQISKSENLFLLSERGYSKLIKIMDTDLAWEIHDKLIDDYFTLREKVKEKQNQKSMSMEDIIIYQMEQSKLMKQQLEETTNTVLEVKETTEKLDKKVEAIKDVVSLDTTSWREDTTNLINKIATFRGGTHNIYQETRREAYELLDKRFGVKLEQRLTNKRRRMAEEGVCKSRRDKLSKLDVISEDKKLIEGYVAVVKDMAIKYGCLGDKHEEE